MLQLSSFLSALPRLTARDFEDIAGATAPSASSAEAELASWRSMLSVDHLLRRRGQVRAAGIASAQARAAVVEAADQAGVPPETVTQVARSAGSVARACVAGPDARYWMVTVLHGWEPFLARCEMEEPVPAA